MPEDISSLVTPRADTEAALTPPPEAAPVEEVTPKSDAAGDLPDELLQIPAIQGLMAGTPGAVSAKYKDSEKSKEGKLIVKNKEALQSAGIGFYRSLSGDLAVMFNQLQIAPADIQKADKAGKLLEIAPPFDVVNREIAKMGPGEHPSLNPKGSGTAPAAPTVNPPPQSANMPMPQSAAPSRAKLQAQMKNLQPQAPTAGPAPGKGNLLRSILKPVL